MYVCTCVCKFSCMFVYCKQDRYVLMNEWRKWKNDEESMNERRNVLCIVYVCTYECMLVCIYVCMLFCIVVCLFVVM